MIQIDDHSMMSLLCVYHYQIDRFYFAFILVDLIDDTIKCQYVNDILNQPIVKCQSLNGRLFLRVLK